MYYFRECANPLDLQMLSAENVRELIHGIAAVKAYDKVIIDLGNGLQEKELAVMSMANSLVMIMDQSEIAMLKLGRYLEYLHAVEEERQADFISKMRIYFNKTLKSIQIPDKVMEIRTGGAFPLIENGNFAGIIDKIAMMELLQNIK